jgi:hypothetical protein
MNFSKKNKLLLNATSAGIAIIPLAWLSYTLFWGTNGDIPVSYI